MKPHGRVNQLHTLEARQASLRERSVLSLGELTVLFGEAAK